MQYVLGAIVCVLLCTSCASPRAKRLEVDMLSWSRVELVNQLGKPDSIVSTSFMPLSILGSADAVQGEIYTYPRRGIRVELMSDMVLRIWRIPLRVEPLVVK